MKLVQGKGVNDYDGKVTINGKPIKSYVVWTSMLNRCYSKRYQERYPTYIGCEVCDAWLSFKNFKEWFDRNYRWDLDELGIRIELDKDLLSTDGKRYSSETCVFIPHEVNNFMTNKQKTNKTGAIGAFWDKKRKRWRVNISDFKTGIYVCVGLYKTLNDANTAYNSARQIQALSVKEYMRELGYCDNIVEAIK